MVHPSVPDLTFGPDVAYPQNTLGIDLLKHMQYLDLTNPDFSHNPRIGLLIPNIIVTKQSWTCRKPHIA